MAFRSKLKIRFGGIDRVGIVYYPRFMHYFHVAMDSFQKMEFPNWLRQLFEKQIDGPLE